ncbi:MAG: hypothetical protein NT168_03935 [Planctomycetota bacterium]|nr:hypothetical protein [Planctomycetota bacterium]
MKNGINRVRMPVSGHPPQTNKSLHHPLRDPGCLGEIIFGDQQVALLSDPRRVTKPGADHMQRELALQFRLPAGLRLLPWRLM